MPYFWWLGLQFDSRGGSCRGTDCSFRFVWDGGQPLDNTDGYIEQLSGSSGGCGGLTRSKGIHSESCHVRHDGVLCMEQEGEVEQQDYR